VRVRADDNIPTTHTPSHLAVQADETALKDHLLTRFLGKEYDGDEQEYTHAERNHVIIQDNRMYYHKTLGISYTSYDLQYMKGLKDAPAPKTAEYVTASQRPVTAHNNETCAQVTPVLLVQNFGNY
jgi:hypothetical protein